MVRLSTPQRGEGGICPHDRSRQRHRGARTRKHPQILEQKDPRLLVVVGPCSIHDVRGAMEYAGKLNALRKEFADQMEIVMRVYFEKPRTTIGWKGLINDPHLDNTHDIEAGLKTARRLLLDINAHGLAGGDGISRPHHPAIHRRPDQLGRHRGADDGIADAPRDGERPFDAGGFQERDGRQPADRD